MEIIPILLTLLVMFLSVIILDYFWLGIITRNFIINQFGSLIRLKNKKIQINLFLGVITWFIIALGCFIFVVYNSESLMQSFIFGAIFGFISYSIYDLTNLTFIKNYPYKFALIDIIWGTILCSIISIIGFLTKTIL